MALAAAQAIDALAARLVPMPATGGRVYTSRAWPLDEASLPAWRVTAADEAMERAGLDNLHRHTLQVEATAYARVAADLDDTLHALASSGLALLFAATAPYDLAGTGITRAITQQGEATVGAITLHLQATYYAHPSAPETILS
jgi:hypothetical protein